MFILVLVPRDFFDLINISESLKQRAGLVDLKTGWRISPDRADNNSHGGSAWKLLDKSGNRIATLVKNGNVLRK